MAVHRKLDMVIDELRPDVAVIAKCASPKVLTGKMMAGQPWTSMVWAGSNRSMGVGVFTFGGYHLTELPIPDPLEWVIPASVSGPTNFTLLGVWASNHRASVGRQLPLVHPKSAAVPDPHVLPGPTVLAGDFNYSVLGNRRYRRDVLRTRPSLPIEQAGLVSTYHHARSEAQGEETEMTFFPRGKGESRRAHHIDYAFIPADWLPRLTAVTVGSEADWVLTGRSNHVPLTIDIADS